MRRRVLSSRKTPWIGVLTGVAMATGLAVGCYSERLPPPTFRYACGSDGDCEGEEACIDGLCQIRCTQATFEDDCPAGGNFAVCLNGVCSNTCIIDEVDCPGEQTCIDFGIDLGDFGGGGFGGGGGTDEPIGVCGTLCEAGDDTCPAGEQCISGFCVATCTTSDDCALGLSCVAGFCFPGEGGGTGGGTTGGDDTGQATTGMTEGATSDATGGPPTTTATGGAT